AATSPGGRRAHGTRYRPAGCWSFLPCYRFRSGTRFDERLMADESPHGTVLGRWAEWIRWRMPRIISPAFAVPAHVTLDAPLRELELRAALGAAADELFFPHPAHLI